MLRRTFLRGSILAPLVAWLGRSKTEASPLEPQDVFGQDVEPYEMTPGFDVFIPHRTRAQREELQALAYCAALEVAAMQDNAGFLGVIRKDVGYITMSHSSPVALQTNVAARQGWVPLQSQVFSHLPSDRMTRDQLADWRMAYIKAKNPRIYRAVKKELAAIRTNGEVRRVESLGSKLREDAGDPLGIVRPGFHVSMELRQQLYVQDYGDNPCYLAGDRSFRMVRHDGEQRAGEGAPYSIDVPECADWALAHIDKIERERPDDLALARMCNWFRLAIQDRAKLRTHSRKSVEGVTDVFAKGDRPLMKKTRIDV